MGQVTLWFLKLGRKWWTASIRFCLIHGMLTHSTQPPCREEAQLRLCGQTVSRGPWGVESRLSDNSQPQPSDMTWAAEFSANPSFQTSWSKGRFPFGDLFKFLTCRIYEQNKYLFYITKSGANLIEYSKWNILWSISSAEIYQKLNLYTLPLDMVWA